MSYPTTLDLVPATGSGTQVLGIGTGNALAGIGLPAWGNALANAVNNIEAYVGITGSAVTTSVTYLVNNIGASQITAGAVGTTQLATNAVTAAKSAISAPTSAQLSGIDGYNFSTSTQSGWLSPNETWTFASFTASSGAAAIGTFTTPTNTTGRYGIGDKIQFVNNSNTIYGYIIAPAPSFSSVTTITYATDSANTVINAAFTSNLYSKESTPLGFPQLLTYVPTVTGFSANPAVSVKFSLNGKLCTVIYAPTAVGTSNATSLIITSPFIAKSGLGDQYSAARGQDNGTEVVALVGISQNTSNINVFKSITGGTWTNTGNKLCAFNFTYLTNF